MKKNILYIFLIPLFLLLGCFYTYADDCSNTCDIQDAPAQVLEDYLDNLSKVINNVSKAISESERETATLKVAQSNILASMSQALNFSGYFSSFDFYVALPITQEVPFAVKRDHERLKRQNERLSRMLQKTTRAGYGDALVPNACDNVDDNCKLNNGTVRSVLTTLFENNKSVTDLYRLSINDKAFVEEFDFILVSPNFQSEITKSYNKDTLTSCSQCKGGFADKIQESIDKIANLNVGGTEGIRSWKEAWAKFTGAIGQSIRTIDEDKVLKDYLAGQGLPGDAAEAVSDNLTRYNSGGLSTSNPLSNSINYTFTNAEQEINSVREGILQELLDTSREDIPTAIINRTIDQVQKTQDIQNDIKDIYEEQLQFLPPQDTKTQQLIAKIIRMHISLSETINIFDKTVKTSEKVCDSQGQGQGKCSYR